MADEVGERQQARQHEGHRPGEQADQQQSATDEFEDPRDPGQRQENQVVERGDVRKAESLAVPCWISR